ncbi:MAG: hypothetical protein II773_07455 [Oscillospiraceae bacterium]|nr:hypothetical protein [Oscillospiraceae bacterium]MBQ4311409.1 hypothetical protein [Oscillospiraceae bacterium]
MDIRPSPLFSLPLPIHIGFIIISTIVLLLSYKRKKQLHRLILLSAIWSSALIYFVEPGISFYILDFEELALFLWVIVLMIKEDRAENSKHTSGSEKTKKEGT